MGDLLAVLAEGVSKRFRAALGLRDLLAGRLLGRPVDALRSVDLRVSRGEVVALMGPNGAGKSTLLRLLAGLLVPDGGRLEVLGVEAARATPALRRRVSLVLGEERSFSYRLTGAQNLEFFAALHGHGPREARSRAARALAAVGLGSAAGQTVGTYSTGMRRRLALGRGLLGEPELLLLDEPTASLDPASARRIRALLREKLLGWGAAAVVATHDLAEAAELAGRVVCLDGGELRGEGPPSEAARLLGVEQGAPAGEARP
jgi:ABC-2 type transport system ATP-binding protein